MKIKSVQICGMHNVESKTYDFSDMVYLFGRNGAGKSTVMQAIQLAILGYIPGTDKTKTAIFRHANADLMSVSVTFDTGQTVTRMFEKSGNTIKSSTVPDNFNPESIMGDLELPVFNFNEFAAMTANKLKDWFINYLPDEDTSVDWSDILKCKQLKLPDDQDMLDALERASEKAFGDVDLYIDNFNALISFGYIKNNPIIPYLCPMTFRALIAF